MKPLEQAADGGTYPVIVVGGGTAGAMAAVAAARGGARTLLIEENGYLGGTATGGLVTPFMSNRIPARSLPAAERAAQRDAVGSGPSPADDGAVNLNRGLTDELKARLAAIQAGAATPDNDGWFDPEGMKFVLEDMALEAGVQLLYYTRFVDVLTAPAAAEAGTASEAGEQRRRITGIVAHTPAGFVRFGAQVVIDASGDADVAVAAGVPWRCGGPSGQRQALSVRFIAGGVDLEALARFLRELGDPAWPDGFLEMAMVWGRGFKLEPVFRRAVEAGDLLESDGDYFQCFTLPGRPGQLAFNCPRIATQVDGTNPWDLTHAQIEGRQAIRRLMSFLRKYLPGCQQAHVLEVAPMVGVRESRRIVGDYVLTLQDVLQARKFSDAVLRNRYPVDIHWVQNSPAGKASETVDSALQPAGRVPEPEEPEVFHHPGFLPEGAYHEVPYRCLLPRGIEGLLVTGRCISATFAAQSAIRIQPNCHSLGQAAGTAAALAVEAGITPRQVDGVHLREVLRSQGACL